jgi:hypothetical protein
VIRLDEEGRYCLFPNLGSDLTFSNSEDLEYHLDNTVSVFGLKRADTNVRVFKAVHTQCEVGEVSQTMYFCAQDIGLFQPTPSGPMYDAEIFYDLNDLKYKSDYSIESAWKRIKHKYASSARAKLRLNHDSAANLRPNTVNSDIVTLQVFTKVFHAFVRALVLFLSATCIWSSHAFLISACWT